MTFDQALHASPVLIARYDGVHGHMCVQIIKQDEGGQSIVCVQISGIDHMTPEEARGLASQLGLPIDHGWEPGETS